jgi:hypothetical protein
VSKQIGKYVPALDTNSTREWGTRFPHIETVYQIGKWAGTRLDARALCSHLIRTSVSY